MQEKSFPKIESGFSWQKPTGYYFYRIISGSSCHRREEKEKRHSLEKRTFSRVQKRQATEPQAKRKEDRKRGYNRKNGTCVTG